MNQAVPESHWWLAVVGQTEATPFLSVCAMPFLLLPCVVLASYGSEQAFAAHLPEPFYMISLLSALLQLASDSAESREVSPGHSVLLGNGCAACEGNPHGLSACRS